MTAVYVFGGILAILVLLGLILGPLLEREPADGAGETAAEDRRDVALEALREVEFEYRTGKLDEEDYRALRNRLAREAVSARKAAAGSGSAASTADGAGSAASREDASRPERAGSAATRGAEDEETSGAPQPGTPAASAGAGAPSGAAIEGSRSGSSPAGTCPECGAPTRGDARFCTSCGTRLKAEGEEG